MIVKRVFGVVALSSIPACQMLFGYEDFAPGKPDIAPCPNLDEPGLHGPRMVQVRHATGECFWIDRTEVTVRDYTEFLMTLPAPAAGPACGWNTTADPDETCTHMIVAAATNEPSDLLPITCIDWCDALAFCLWAEKELCRDDSSATPSGGESDWLTACSDSSGTRRYGCAPGCGATTCRGSGLAPVGFVSECATATGDDAVSDLSGNAAEWTAACSSDADDGSCIQRGGSYAAEDNALECANWMETPRSRVLPTLGFRCCARE